MPARVKHHKAEKTIAIGEKPAVLDQINPEEPAEPMTQWERETHEEAKQSRVVLSAALREMSDRDVINLREFYRVMEANVCNSQTPVEDFIVDLPMWWKRHAEQGEGLTPDDIVEMVNSPDGPRSWFEDGVNITRFFSKRYSHVIAEEALPEEAA